MMRFFDSMAGANAQVIDPTDALPGRDEPLPVPASHLVLGNPLESPFPVGSETAIFGMGCFWGAERMFWQTPGVWTTAVGYAGGYTPNPSYEEVCSGHTGHTEAVFVVFDPTETSYEELLRIFWEGHDPTQGMRQGNDMGTQYRSAAYWTTEKQRAVIERTRHAFQMVLNKASYGPITTEIREAPTFYYAEHPHHQYLEWNKNGYCGISSTGLSCPTGIAEVG